MESFDGLARFRGRAKKWNETLPPAPKHTVATGSDLWELAGLEQRWRETEMRVVRWEQGWFVRPLKVSFVDSGSAVGHQVIPHCGALI